MVDRIAIATFNLVLSFRTILRARTIFVRFGQSAPSESCYCFKRADLFQIKLGRMNSCCEPRTMSGPLALVVVLVADLGDRYGPACMFQRGTAFSNEQLDL
jgi:hypothetical protein